MKKMFLLLVLVFSFSANASLLIEPYFGMALSGEVDNGSDSVDYDSATEFGARLGWQSLGLQLGVDYRIHESKVDDFPTEFDAKHNAVYGFIGYEFPVMLRVYGGYAFTGTGKFDGAEMEGFNSNYIGVSYTGLPFLAINLERVNFDWDKFEYTGADSDAEWSHYLLSLSFPITL